MNNAVFGKTMENVRNRIDMRVCTNWDQARKLIARPNFQNRTIFFGKFSSNSNEKNMYKI